MQQAGRLPEGRAGYANANATLVIDQACIDANAIKATLVLPDRFTLAGVGINGEGILQFSLPENVMAIRFAPSPGVVHRFATIRDLTIVGGCCGQTGIDVSNSQFVYIRNVRLSVSRSASPATTRSPSSSTAATSTTTPPTSSSGTTRQPGAFATP